MRYPTAVLADEPYDVIIRHVLGEAVFGVVASNCQTKGLPGSWIVGIPRNGRWITVLPGDISQKFRQNVSNITTVSSACFRGVRLAVSRGVLKLNVRFVYDIECPVFRNETISLKHSLLYILF